MSTELAAALTSGSVDASLTEIDARTSDVNRLRNQASDVGPFGVFSLLDAPNPHQLQDVTREQEIDPPVDFSSASELDSPLNVGNFLGWNDLFDTGLDFTSPYLTTKPIRILLRSLILLQLGLTTANNTIHPETSPL